MSDRLSYVLLAVSAAAMLAVNVAVKPGLDAKEVREFAEMFSRGREWQERVAPDFELTLRDGSSFHLADHMGREVIVLNFFATWCVPCRDEMPELQQYMRRMSDHGERVRLIAIDAQERPDQVDRMFADLKLQMPAGIDEDGQIEKKYGVTALPTTVVIGADGRIKLYTAGAISNADVAFGPVLANEFDVLAKGHGISRDAYVKLAAEAPPVVEPAKSGNASDSSSLTGRARSIAEAMPCPCGCSDKVIACSCQTATGIKTRLREGVDASLTDGQVMERLNKEFCMKGM